MYFLGPFLGPGHQEEQNESGDLTALAEAVAEGATSLSWTLCFLMWNHYVSHPSLLLPALPHTWPEVPVVHAQSIRLGDAAATGIVGKEHKLTCSTGKSWKNNVSRKVWKVFKQRKLGWDVKMKTFDYITESGDTIPITYISPCDLFEYLVNHHPGVLVGGLQSQVDRAEHLQAFWQAFRLQHQDHIVYSEHDGQLETVIPIYWHGDEGRGKRRGNTAVVAMECVFGNQTAVSARKKRPYAACQCQPSSSLKRRFGDCNRKLTQKQLDILRLQTTTMKGHSFLHHWPLFIIPSSIHHEHPKALMQLLDVMSKDFRQLFYEGCTGSDGKTYNAVVIGAKGDLKWFTKIALQRSYENQGRIAAYACCHECMAGQPGVPWEELASDRPAWSLTRYAQRPWTDIPCTVQIPYCPQIPEKQFKRDPFHTLKLEVYRDIAGSILCFLVAKGYFGTVGDFDSKLKNAHMGFTLYCRTVGKSPALRTFSRRLFMLPRLDKYPWSNTKGSDTMILIDWLTVALAGFENVPLDNSHLPTFRLMKATCKAARKVFTDLNEHGLWAMRPCSMVFYSNMQGLIRGYCALASVLLNDEFNGFAIKPKLHLLRHTTLEIDEALQQGDQCVLNWNSVNCEADEDMIGRTCRLSRRLDSGKIGERVLGCVLLKAGIMWNRFRKLHKI